MALVDPTTWQQWSGISVTGAQLAALEVMCQQVSDAIGTELRRNLERRDYTNIILAAPPTTTISLFRYSPIRLSGLEVYFNVSARGDPTAFTADDLLTIYEDYTLDTGDENGVSPGGLITYLRGLWSASYVRPAYSIAVQRIPSPGAIKVNFTGGYDQVPGAIVEAACLAVSKLRKSRNFGGQQSSESWNGYSYSLPSAALAILQDPNISTLLDLYRNYGALI